MLVRVSTVCIYYTQKSESRNPIRKEEWKPNVVMISLVVVACAVSIVWAVVFKPVSIVTKTTNGEISKFEVSSEDNQDEFQIAVLVYHGILHIATAIIVWPALLRYI